MVAHRYKKVFDIDFSATTETILLTTSLFMRSCFLEQISLFFIDFKPFLDDSSYSN